MERGGDIVLIGLSGEVCVHFVHVRLFSLTGAHSIAHRFHSPCCAALELLVVVCRGRGTIGKRVRLGGACTQYIGCFDALDTAPMSVLRFGLS